MSLRVNGLYGWVRHNDRRSIALFGGFVVALNVGAVLVLAFPLLALDPAHAPLSNWGGYAERYIPLVTLSTAAVFTLQMLWHVKATQRSMAFRFVDNADEPRLCALVEPLAIGMGLPAPYVGVIETGALNAFACGVTRRDAVVVVTRGLIDELDDDELAAVLAHELAHIANGDIRLLAAANACLRMVGWMVRPRRRARNKLQEVAAFPMVMIAMPPLFVFTLLISFCAQSALRGSRLVRLLIASSREFVADARAIEATHNPAALVSALERIRGRSQLGALLPGQDAMMIDGAADGPFATHPPMAKRLAAIVATTGSMALIAPARRDTRPKTGSVPSGARLRASLLGAMASGPALKAEPADDRNWLGLTPTMSVGALLAIVVFLGMHRSDLTAPTRLAAALDPRPAGALFITAGRLALCDYGAVGSLVLGKTVTCSSGAMNAALAEQAKVGGPVGQMLGAMATDDGVISIPSAPTLAEAAEIRDRHCFRTDPYTRGDRGLFSLDAPPRPDGGMNVRLWMSRASNLAYAVIEANDTGLPKAIAAYLEARKDSYERIDRFFGEPGLAYARQAYASDGHERALKRIHDALREPSIAARLGPVDLAEATLLTASPDTFVSCIARDRG